ncbi:TetR/AcrR family transcriptional regulator [Corynebacterium mendelii]|uniref:TetR/AcrR family transcriptional regulator n=1 Tax=Corynebacterium mendelii TaxID=2765362 RepID=A0A939E152_9CORY|nr:TetR/AcrR family transcriptional regulator [Corynebacterium mendelii]MBN9644519.1 TetR/AcrR family transcriptional regulator [Corynebacterium mendelii]
MTAAPSRIGRKPVFNKDSLGAAGLKVGLLDITVAAVAKEVGVRSSALYRLVNDRTDLVVLAVEKIASLTPLLPGHGSWQEVLRDFADRLWGICESYPGFSSVLLTAPGTTAAFTPHLAGVRDQLVAHGFTDRQASFALAVVGDCVVGTHKVIDAIPGPADDNGRTGDAPGYARPADPATWQRDYLSVKLDFLITSLGDNRPSTPVITTADPAGATRLPAAEARPSVPAGDFTG